MRGRRHCAVRARGDLARPDDGGRVPAIICSSPTRPTVRRAFFATSFCAPRRRDDLLRPDDRRGDRPSCCGRTPTPSSSRRPGSQSFEMQDVPAIAAAAHAHGICVVMDNTWATPLFFPPLERGVDLAIEAGTKYLSGHSDLMLGLVSANAALVAASCARRSTCSPCARDRRMSSWRCAVCARWSCACARPSARGSPWRTGSPRGPR